MLTWTGGSPTVTIRLSNIDSHPFEEESHPAPKWSMSVGCIVYHIHVQYIHICFILRYVSKEKMVDDGRLLDIYYLIIRYTYIYISIYRFFWNCSLYIPFGSCEKATPFFVSTHRRRQASEPRVRQGNRIEVYGLPGWEGLVMTNTMVHHGSAWPVRLVW